MSDSLPQSCPWFLNMDINQNLNWLLIPLCSRCALQTMICYRFWSLSVLQTAFICTIVYAWHPSPNHKLCNLFVLWNLAQSLPANNDCWWCASFCVKTLLHCKIWSNASRMLCSLQWTVSCLIYPMCICCVWLFTVAYLTVAVCGCVVPLSEQTVCICFVSV